MSDVDENVMMKSFMGDLAKKIVDKAKKAIKKYNPEAK